MQHHHQRLERLHAEGVVTRQQRERAKATNFGIMNGLSAYGLSEQVDIPVEEARAFIEAYFAKYPKVKEFREQVIDPGFGTTSTPSTPPAASK